MFHWCGLSLIVAGFIWYVLRKVVRQVTANDDYILYVDEFSGNVFSGVFIMELGIVASDYGFYSIVHFTGGFIMLFIRNRYFTYESVCAFVDHYYSNGRKCDLPLLHIASNIVSQITGMVLGQSLARYFWSFDAFDSHSHTQALDIACRTAISGDHSFAFVAFAEFLGPLTMCIAAYFVSSEFVPLTVTAVAFVNVYFFAHVSGSFYNQSMATAFTFHCEGYESDLEFFFIYWIAPTLGQIVAWELLTNGKKLLGGEENVEKVEKIEKVE